MNFVKEVTLWSQAVVIAVKAVINNHVLVLRKAALGDVLWTEPVLRKLSANGRQVFLITEFCSLFDNAPFPHFRCIDNSARQYKRAAKLLNALHIKKHVVYLNNSYEKQPNQHFLHVYQLAAGLPKQEEYPRLYLTEDEKNRYKHLRPYAIIHLETTSPLNYRQVYGIEWESITSYLKDKNLTPYFVAQKPADYQLPYHHKLSSLRDMIAFIYSASLFIGIDSGPSHIAASMRIPSIIFFGSVNPWYRHFKSLFHGIIMQGSCEFANCYHLPRKKKKNHSCLLVGDVGIPKCCVFTNMTLMLHVNKLYS